MVYQMLPTINNIDIYASVGFNTLRFGHRELSTHTVRQLMQQGDRELPGESVFVAGDNVVSEFYGARISTLRYDMVLADHAYVPGKPHGIVTYLGSVLGRPLLGYSHMPANLLVCARVVDGLIVWHVAMWLNQIFTLPNHYDRYSY